MATIIDLGRLVKAKYPGQYEDLTDYEVGQKVKTKFPTQYNDFVDAPEPVTQDRNLLQKAAGFLGVEKFGQGFASAGRVLSGAADQTGNEQAAALQQQSDIMKRYAPGTPERQRAMEQFSNTYKGGIDTQAQIDPGTQLSNKEVLGSAALTALNVASAGGLSNAGKLGTVAAGINKVAAPLSEVTKLGRVGNAALGGIEAGAAYGAAQGLNDNQDLTGIAKNAAISGLAGGAISGGVKSISEIGKLVANRNVSSSIYDKAIGNTKKMVQSGRTGTGQLLDEGVIGTKRGIMAREEKVINTVDSQIEKIIPKSGSFHKPEDIIAQIRDNLQTSYGLALSDEQLNKIMRGLPIESLRNRPAIDTATLNQLRKQIDSKYLGNSNWLRGALEKEPEKITALKAAANVMRDTVQATDNRLPALFSRYSEAISNRTALDTTLSSPHALTNILEIVASTLAGSAIGGGITMKSLATALATYGGLKAATSAPVLTGLAVGLDKAGKKLANPGNIQKVVKPITRIITRNITNKIGR